MKLIRLLLLALVAVLPSAALAGTTGSYFFRDRLFDIGDAQPYGAEPTGNEVTLLRPGQSAWLMAYGNTATITDIDRSTLDESCPANVTRITATSHGYKVGDVVRIDGAAGITEINGGVFAVVSVGDANTFYLDLDSSTGYSAWSSGGTSTLENWGYLNLSQCRAYSVGLITNIDNHASGGVTAYPWRCPENAIQPGSPGTWQQCDPIDFGNGAGAGLTVTDPIYFDDVSPQKLAVYLPSIPDGQAALVEVDCR